MASPRHPREGSSSSKDEEFELDARNFSGLGEYALATSSRTLSDGTVPGAAAHRSFAPAAVDPDAVFNIAEQPVFKSAGAPAMLSNARAMEPAPLYRAAHAAPSGVKPSVAPQFASAAPVKQRYAHPGMNVLAAAQRSRAAAAMDLAMFSAESEIMPPQLPPPPFPLERHTYSLSGTVQNVLSAVVLALQGTLIDADFVPSECRWECAVSAGKRACFHVFLHTVMSSGTFALEFQRRQGCSIVFNMAVRGVLAQLANKFGAPLAPFEREPCTEQTPTVGFSVGSFDIPDVPLGLVGLDEPLTSASSLLDDDDDDDTDGASTDRAEEDGDGVRTMLNLANSTLAELAEEGVTGLSILSRGHGREVLLQPAHLTSVAKCAAKAFQSKNTSVLCAAASLAANLTEDKRAQRAIVDAGCVPLLVARAAKVHSANDAHIRRESVRALAHLSVGQTQALHKAGAAAGLRAACDCPDMRIKQYAHRALVGLGQQ